MTSNAHDPLLSACSRQDWSAAARHWREGAPASPQRALAALLSALTSMDAHAAGAQDRPQGDDRDSALRGAEEALGMDQNSRMEAADSALRPLCSRACQGLSGRDDARAAHCFQALASQLASHGMHECLRELSESLAGSPLAASLALSLEPLVERLFPLDAKRFLGALCSRERRLAPASLSAALLECDPHWLPQIKRALARCSRAQARYWPDGREDLAATAAAAIKSRQEAIELYGSASVNRPSALTRRL